MRYGKACQTVKFGCSHCQRCTGDWTALRPTALGEVPTIATDEEEIRYFFHWVFSEVVEEPGVLIPTTATVQQQPPAIAATLALPQFLAPPRPPPAPMTPPVVILPVQAAASMAPAQPTDCHRIDGLISTDWQTTPVTVELDPWDAAPAESVVEPQVHPTVSATSTAAEAATTTATVSGVDHTSMMVCKPQTPNNQEYASFEITPADYSQVPIASDANTSFVCVCMRARKQPSCLLE